ncbi:head-tail adaptor protein [[Ruminococcus] torques]|nr:head-tail adaptor protein [[Ruminococcus] torques]
MTNKIYIRFRSGIKSTMRIKHGDRIFEIESVLGDKRSGMLTIMAREVA